MACPERSRAQSLDHLTTADGLAQNRTTGVVQDARGFYWVGTVQGLQRYDGHTFVDYPLPGWPSKILLQDRIMPHLVDSRGRLWLSSDRGLIRLDLETGELILFGGVLSSYSQPVTEASDSTIWIAYGDRLAAVAAGSDTGIVHLRTRPKEWFMAVDADPAGRLWLATSGEPSSTVLCYDPATRHTRRYTVPNVEDISRILVGPDGHVWISEPVSGLHLLDPETGRLMSIPLGLQDQRIMGLVLGEDNAVWFNTAEQFGWVDPRSHEVTLADLGDGPFLFDGVFRDREEAFWLTSLARGLIRYSLVPRPFHYLGRRASPPLGLSSDFAFALHEDDDGTIWIGTLDAGLNRVSADGRTATAFRHDPSDPRSLAHDRVWALQKDRRGQLWIGVSGALCTPASEGFDCYHLGESTPFHIEADEDGALLLAVGGSGLERFDPITRHFTTVSEAEPLQNATTLCLDRSGVLWVGTVQGRHTAQSGLWRVDSARPGLPVAVDGLEARTIFDIHEDAEGALWLGTERGLARLSPDRKMLTWIAIPGGPRGTTVFSVAPDDDGRLWLGTGHGLVRFNPATGALRRFDRRDGVGVSEFNRKTWTRLRDGRLLFGGVDGLIAFDPAALDTEPAARPVALTRFVRTSNEGITEEVLYGTRDFVLTPGDHAFSFEFVAPGFARPYRHRYRYRLDGFDPDWVEVGPERRALYTRLSPGHYTFRVQHALDDEPWIEPGVAARVVILPPFWGTLWFQALAVILLTGLLFAVHQARVRQLLAVERMRLHLAADLHDDIGANLSAIALLSDGVRARADLAETERGHLERISTSARATLIDMRDIVWSIDPSLDRFDDLVTKMQDTTAVLLPGVRCHFLLPEGGVPETLSMTCRRNVFLAFKEALHNVARHARATEVEVRLAVRGDWLTLTVHDNGMGLNGHGHGTGLRSMHERAERLGGRCEVESTPGGGTKVCLEVRMT